MTFKEIAEIGAAIIASLGGGGAIVLGLSNFIGKHWADRGLEKQRYEYSQLNLAFQNQLDIATRRLQIELDALGLIHKLRTQEEFSQLPVLWKHMATLRNSFSRLAYQGLVLLPAEAVGDPEERKKWNAEVRQEFDTSLNAAIRFLAENGLFIPKNIYHAADAATKAATAEQYNFAAFRPYVENELPRSMSGEDAHEIVEMRQKYTKFRNGSFKEFNEAMSAIENLMRHHIEGSMPTVEEQHEDG